MNQISREVLAQVERNWSNQVTFLQSLVRHPSTLQREADIQRFMKAAFRDMDLDVQAFEPDIGVLSQLPGFSPPEWSYRGRPNVVGVWRSDASDGQSLVLNGHVDVVSPEPTSLWTYDPWGATIVGDRLYGRGACDMKAGLSAMVYAVRAIQTAGVQLRGDVILQSVIEEECTGNGTLACLARGFTGDGCLILEPFYARAMVAQVGVLWCRVKVWGAAAHAMGANRAVNAIEKMYLLIEAMRKLETKLNQDRHPAFRWSTKPIQFNPGIVRGGEWPSSVPAACELEFRMGYYPDMSPAEARTMVRECLQDAAAEDPWLCEHPPDISFYGFQAEGTAVSFEDSPVIQTLNSAHKEVSGRELSPISSTAATDSRYFLLYHDIPATCYGPRGGNIHGVDEYVELPTVQEATKVIATFILDWCGVA